MLEVTSKFIQIVFVYKPQGDIMTDPKRPAILTHHRSAVNNDRHEMEIRPADNIADNWRNVDCPDCMKLRADGL